MYLCDFHSLRAIYTNIRVRLINARKIDANSSFHVVYEVDISTVAGPKWAMATSPAVTENVF